MIPVHKTFRQVIQYCTVRGMQVTYFITVIYYVIHVAKTVITVFATGLKVIIRNALNIDLLVAIILVSSMKKQRLNP